MNWNTENGSELCSLIFTSVVYPQIDQKWCIWSSSHSAESDLFSNLGPISMVSKDWKEPRKGKATTRTHVYFASGWGRQWVWRWEGERRCWNPSTLLIYSTICMTTFKMRTLMMVLKRRRMLRPPSSAEVVYGFHWALDLGGNRDSNTLSLYPSVPLYTSRYPLSHTINTQFLTIRGRCQNANKLIAIRINTTTLDALDVTMNKGMYICTTPEAAKLLPILRISGWARAALNNIYKRSRRRFPCCVFHFCNFWYLSWNTKISWREGQLFTK